MVKAFRASGMVAVVGFATLIFAHPVAAANVTVHLGSNTPGDCSTVGYINPANVIIDSGDRVTFSVPADDPDGGVDISNLPQGAIGVDPGASVTSDPISSTTSYSATSRGGCAVGDGTITVNAAAPAAPVASSTPTASSGSSSSTTTPTPATTIPAAVTPTPATSEPTIISDQGVASTSTTPMRTRADAATTTTKPSGSPLPVIAIIIGVVVLAAAGFFVYRFKVRRPRVSSALPLPEDEVVANEATIDPRLRVTSDTPIRYSEAPVAIAPEPAPTVSSTAPKRPPEINPYKIPVQ